MPRTKNEVPNSWIIHSMSERVNIAKVLRQNSHPSSQPKIENKRRDSFHEVGQEFDKSCQVMAIRWSHINWNPLRVLYTAYWYQKLDILSLSNSTKKVRMYSFPGLSPFYFGTGFEKGQFWTHICLFYLIEFQLFQFSWILIQGAPSSLKEVIDLLYVLWIVSSTSTHLLPPFFTILVPFIPSLFVALIKWPGCDEYAHFLHGFNLPSSSFTHHPPPPLPLPLSGMNWVTRMWWICSPFLHGFNLPSSSFLRHLLPFHLPLLCGVDWVTRMW